MRAGTFRYSKKHTIVIVLGALPLVVWSFQSRSVLPEFILAAYLLTGIFVLSVLIGYPGPGNGWFWKPLSIFAVLHCALLGILTLGAVITTATGVRPPTTMLFGSLAVAMGIEGLTWTRLMQIFLLKHDRSSRKNLSHKRKRTKT